MKETNNYITIKIKKLINDLEKQNPKEIIETAKFIADHSAFIDGKFNETKGQIDDKKDRVIRQQSSALMGLAYLYSAQNYCEAGNFDIAIDRLCEAYRQFGSAEKIKSEQTIYKNEISQRTRKSAIIKHERENGETRKIVEELLVKLKPENGWESIEDTAKIIDAEINKLDKKYHIGRDTEEWIRTRYKNLRKTFEENASEKWREKYKNPKLKTST